MADTNIRPLCAPHWLPGRLQDAVVRYEWATTHVLRLNEVLRKFNDLESWAPEQAPDLPEGMVRIRIFQNPPRDIGLIIGDIVHSLRSSLDYAICGLVQMQNPDADLNNIHFPFGRPGEPLNSKERKNLKGIGDIALQYIEQAREMGNAYLEVLRRTSNQDKHRLIVTMMHRQMPMKVEKNEKGDAADIVPDMDRVGVWMEPIEDGDIIEMGNILALFPSFFVEGYEAPFALKVIVQFFHVSHQTLCLMMEAAETIRTIRAAAEGLEA